MIVLKVKPKDPNCHQLQHQPKMKRLEDEKMIKQHI